MENVNASVLPVWLQEFRRFQVLMSQIYLYGNVYDCFYYPVNYHSAESEDKLQWAKFNELKHILNLYLRSEGYEIVTYYDLIDGITLESSDPAINPNTIMKFLEDDRPGITKDLRTANLDAIKGSLADTLSFLRISISRSPCSMPSSRSRRHWVHRPCW